jgi:hypothetical protein
MRQTIPISWEELSQERIFDYPKQQIQNREIQTIHPQPTFLESQLRVNL